MIEAFEDGVVEFFQRSGLDTAVPDDLWNELHDIQDVIRIHGHFEHPGDAL